MHRRITHQEEMKIAAVDPDGHAKHNSPRRGANTPNRAQCLAHPVRGPRRMLRVPRPAKQQQDRVATPLHEVGAVGLGGSEQRPEGAV